MALPNTGLEPILKDDTETGETGADKINAIMDYLEINKISMQGFMNPASTNGGFTGKQLVNGSNDFKEGDYIIIMQNGIYDFATGATALPGTGTKLELGDRYAFIAGQWIPTQPPRSRNKGWFNPKISGGGVPAGLEIINGTHEYKNGDYLIANNSAGFDFDNGVRDPNGEEVKTSDRIAYDGSKWFVLQASLGLMQGWFDPTVDGGGLSLKEAVTNSSSTYVYGEYVIAAVSGKYDFSTGLTGTASAVQIDVGTIVRWEGTRWDIMRSLNDNPNKGFAKFDADGGDVHPIIKNGGGYNEGDFFIALVGGLYDLNSGTTELSPTPRTVEIKKGQIARMGAGDIWEIVAEQSVGGNSGVPTGTVIMYPTLSPPDGYLLCNGAQVPAIYLKLIGLVGATLPDMRDQFVRGASTQAQITGFKKFRWTTARPRTQFSGAASSSGLHDHSFQAESAGKWGGSADGTGGGSYFGYVTKQTGQSGAHVHNVLIRGGGDAETAPDHTRMAFMIKHD